MEDSLIKIDVGKRRIFLTACHRIPERSFHYNGKPLICYRCLGMNGTFFLSLIIQGLLLLIGIFTRNNISIGEYLNFFTDDLRYMLLMSIIMQLPFIIDGTVQALTKYRSNNPLRLLTGFIGGLGQFNFTYLLAVWVLRFSSRSN